MTKVPFSDGNHFNNMMNLVEFYQRQEKHAVERAINQAKLDGTNVTYTPNQIAVMTANSGLEYHNKAVGLLNLLNECVEKEKLAHATAAITNEVITGASSTGKVVEEEIKKIERRTTPMKVIYDEKEMGKIDDVKVGPADTKELVRLYSIKGIGTVIEGEITDEDRKNPNIVIEKKDVYKDSKKTGEQQEVRKRNMSGKEKAIKLYKELLSAAGVNISHFKDAEFARLLNAFVNKHRDVLGRVKSNKFHKEYAALKLPLTPVIISKLKLPFLSK